VKVRVRFEKRGKIRFLSHRDLARIWERSLRRAGISVAYSEGFSPRPRLHFGLALSTGHESLAEYLDIDLAVDADVGIDDLPGRVNPYLPVGMAAVAAAAVLPGTDSLQQAVTSCSWELEVVGAAPPAVASVVERVLAATSLPIVVERKGSPVELDARPAILALALAPDAVSAPDSGVTPLRPGSVLLAELATQPRSLRPAELVRALDPDWVEGRVLRTHQWTLVDGAHLEPISLPEHGPRGATSTPHAAECAS
jgi:radical SAM-linked protein